MVDRALVLIVINILMHAFIDPTIRGYHLQTIRAELAHQKDIFYVPPDVYSLHIRGADLTSGT